MSDDNVKPFLPKEISPHAIVADLQNLLSQLSEVYVVLKTKDGQWAESMCGDQGGLSYAIMRLQQFWFSL